MVKNYQIRIPLATLILLALFPLSYLYSSDCIRCHSKLKAGKFVHTVLKDGECTDCHTSETGEHPFKLSSEGNSLCLTCHENPARPGERIHPALEQGACIDCHDPHSSNFAKNLKDRIPALCYNCHESNIAGKVVHLPAKEGECLSCHKPHSSQNESLLVTQKKELCYQCHDRVDNEKFVHAAVAMKSCTFCHTPHSSNNPKLIKEMGSDSKSTAPLSVRDVSFTQVCAQCHRDKGEARSVRHMPFAQGKCLLCHKPHGSDFNKLLTKPSSVLCRDCHDQLPLAGKKKKVSQKKVLGDREFFFITSKRVNGGDDDLYIHGAVRTGRCSVCHEPHQSDNLNILRLSETAKLCFQCHSDDLTGRPSIHPPAGDGTCDVCHSPHGSTFQSNLLDSVPSLCYNCHDKVDGGKNVHPALKVNGCSGCHNPHGSDYKPLLMGELNELCIKCHQDKKDGSHIITGFTYQLHPVKGPEDPKRDGKEFSCVSCHNPHSSDNPKLFYEGSNREEMCKRCHKI